MRWNVCLSLLLIVAGGVLVAGVGIRSFEAITRGAGESTLDVDETVDQLVENFNFVNRVLPLVFGGAALSVGVVLAVRETVLSRRRRKPPNDPYIG